VAAELSDELAPVAFVPGTSSSTRAARNRLPDTVPHRDAARNAARAALLVTALGGRTDLLLDATEEWIHQPYRAAGMPRSAALMAELRDRGVAAVVSGAGPTVLALTTAAGRDELLALDRRGWTPMALDVDFSGASILPI
jgi:homoserine kinase